MRSMRVNGVHNFENIAVTRDLFNVRVRVILQRHSDVEITVVIAVQLANIEYLKAVQRLHQLNCLITVQRWSYPLSWCQLRCSVLRVVIAARHNFSSPVQRRKFK